MGNNAEARAIIRAAYIGGIFALIAAIVVGVFGLLNTMLANNPPAAKILPEQIALTPQASNAAWKPYITEQDFGGIPMMLVPAGCFIMGAEAERNDEKPVHEQCFRQPYWIDKTEVANRQIGSTGCMRYSSESSQPRNCIGWDSASNFCKSRDARLPTEAEWEYAARGPDGLIYPWGNEYVAEYVVGKDDPTYGNTKAAPVAQKPANASWVGALDMSGNLWEWTSSLYRDYPYGASHESASAADDHRVLRGGSFMQGADVLRLTYRYANKGDGDLPTFGFRCARDFDG